MLAVKGRMVPPDHGVLKENTTCSCLLAYTKAKRPLPDVEYISRWCFFLSVVLSTCSIHFCSLRPSPRPLPCVPNTPNTPSPLEELHPTTRWQRCHATAGALPLLGGWYLSRDDWASPWGLLRLHASLPGVYNSIFQPPHECPRYTVEKRSSQLCTPITTAADFTSHSSFTGPLHSFSYFFGGSHASEEALQPSRLQRPQGEAEAR